jgi:hypothetical protein
MKAISTIAVGVLALFVIGSSPAKAGLITYNIFLTGDQAVTPNVTTASGSATVTVDDVADTVSVVLSFTGLTGGAASAAHIHCCVATTANGPVVIPFTGFPASTSGTYTNTFTGVSPANIAGIEAGLAYINIHDATFPGGEIRGDILTPEPGTYALMGLGILGIVAVRNRRLFSKSR